MSIGVALALLAMAVLPIGVGAYDLPATYSKVPFAIVQSGIELVGELLDILVVPLGLPEWLNSDLTDPIAGWAGGPLSWTVDMLAWGLGLGSDLMDALASVIDMPFDVGALLDTVACSLLTCFAVAECSGNFTPCP